MKFSYNWLKELTGIRESPQKLAEFLALRAFEVESIQGKYPKEHSDDWALDIKIFSNRAADAAGHVGMAKEIATLKKLKVKSLKLKVNESTGKRASDFIRVVIEDPNDCLRYTARVMTGVKVGPSPKWLAERLETCGIQAINNLVDAANYVMLELGQPLHVFDYDKLKNTKSKAQIPNKAQSPRLRTIIVRRVERGERLLALDEKTYPLSPEVLVIADEREPIAIAGIKGGKDSGVSTKTKTIVLESANFDPARIRIGAKLLALKTDASYRFERGMDPNETLPAIDRLAQIIQKVAGGEVLAGRVDASPRPLKPVKILLRLDYANRLIGADIPGAFYALCFRRLGWGFRKRTSREYLVEPPTVRRDIRIEEDIIEEVVRLWGYERIPARPPAVPLAPTAPNEERWWEERIKNFLVGAGYTETYTYNFVDRELLEAFGDSSQNLLEITNPTNPDARYLAAHPAQQYLKSAADNLRHQDTAAIFGIAKGFKPAAKPSPKVPAKETKYLVMVKATKDAKGTKGKNGAETFYAVKGALDQLFESLGIADYWYDDALTAQERRKAHALHPYRTAKVMAGNTFLGIIAELHPLVTERLKAKARLVFAEIVFEKLWKLARAEAEFRPIGKYPAIIRDIAVVVPENTKADQVEGIIQTADGKLLVDSDLFDYFQDETLARHGVKSLAFHLIFQSPERTLTDREVNRLVATIARALKERGWEIRE